MAARWFGVDLGGTHYDVTEGATTTSKAVEVTVANTSVVTTQEQLLRAVEYIRMYIIAEYTKYPPH